MKSSVKVFRLVDGEVPEIVLHGTINDVRKWAKDRWAVDSEWVKEMTGVETEEDFYLLMDGDVTLSNFLHDTGYYVEEVCEVPIEDFEE